MAPTLSPQQFVARWCHATLKERSASQSHFNDLCSLLGQPTPPEADPAGRWYTFEAGAGKTAGGEGFADVWKMGYFAWEYPAWLDLAHRALDAAALAAYGRPQDLSDDEILARLLALNLERAGKR